VPHIFFKLILCTNSWYLLIRTCHVICLPKSQPMHGLSEVGLDFPYMQRIIRETGSVGRVTESLIQSSLCMCIHLFISFRIYYCCFSFTWCSRATSTSLTIATHTRSAHREKSGYGPNVLLRSRNLKAYDWLMFPFRWAATHFASILTKCCLQSTPQYESCPHGHIFLSR